MAQCDMCKGTTFKYKVRAGKNVCPSCQGGGLRRVVSTFPFTTTHMSPDGQPITVNSITHLRKLESQYGVQSFSYNQNRPERDWTPDRGEIAGIPLRKK